MTVFVRLSGVQDKIFEGVRSEVFEVSRDAMRYALCALPNGRMAFSTTSPSKETSL